MSDYKPKYCDGGPAFPFVTHGSTDDHERCVSGMSLRDYFAAMAMQGLIASHTGNQIVKHVPEGTLVMPAREGIPVLAYEYADRMLDARTQSFCED